MIDRFKELSEPQQLEVRQVIDQFVGTTLRAVPDSSLVTLESADDISGYDLPEFYDDLHDFFQQFVATREDLKSFTFQPQATVNYLGNDEGNAVRFKLLLRTYATLSQGDKPHTGTQHAKWQVKGICKDAMHPGYQVYVLYKQYDNTIQIGSWSKNERDADRMAFVLEEQLDTYGKLFKAKGLGDLVFLQRADEERTSANYTYYGALLRFLVRTTKLKLVYEKELETLAIQLIVKK